MINVVQELRKVIDEDVDKKYYLYNGKDVLNLPLHVPVEIPILQFMKDFYEKYISLIGDSNKILKECGVKDIDEIIDKVKIFCKAYIQMHETILSGNAASAYQEMENILSDDYFIKAELKKQDPPLLLYRARTGINWTQKEDFYHIPFNKTYLCDSYRFSIAGYPSLYLGFSKEVCKKELREEKCSCIELELKKDVYVIDLTWDKDYVKSNSASTFLLAYPVIAACYVVPFYCKNMKRECPDIKQKFKEQYLFPQFVTMFVKKNPIVEGIMYFTTRDENLNPLINEDKNLALFPKYTNNAFYDEELIGKFDWTDISIL